jgi:hypothetical protein
MGTLHTGTVSASTSFNEIPGSAKGTKGPKIPPKASTGLCRGTTKIPSDPPRRDRSRFSDPARPSGAATPARALGTIMSDMLVLPLPY